MTWELEAREAIRDTLAAYNHCGDRLDLDGLAATFCDEGVLEVRGRGAPMVGRAAIAAGLQRGLASGGERTIVRHNVANTRFDSLSRDEAHVSSYFSVLTDVGLDHYGRYRDTLVPVDGAWLFKHRLVSVDWRAENSLFPA